MEGDFIKIHSSLLPLSFLYGMGVRFRNLLFDMGILKSKSFTMPVISVGNITIGGAGKTPHVEYLIRLLNRHARVAVLSRGYKRRTKGYVLAGEGVTASDIGDEPKQMFMKYGMGGSALSALDSKGVKHGKSPKPVYVAVNADRVNGINRLRHDAATSDTDVILLDDAYQHRYVKPGVNILLVDYHRLIIYDRLLPAGRLREPKEGKQRADVVIVTKCPKDLRPMDFRVITKAMDLYPYQKLFFTTLNYGSLCPVFSGKESLPLSSITPQHNIIVLTGIASPQHLLLDLRSYTDKLTPLSYRDHHSFTPKDASRINNMFDTMPEPKLIITTEKDAARLQELDGLSDEVRRSIYALPIEISFMLDQGELFDEYILSYVQKNSKNSILSKLKDTEDQQRKHRRSDSKKETKQNKNTEIPHKKISFK